MRDTDLMHNLRCGYVKSDITAATFYRGAFDQADSSVLSGTVDCAFGEASFRENTASVNDVARLAEQIRLHIFREHIGDSSNTNDHNEIVFVV